MLDAVLTGVFSGVLAPLVSVIPPSIISPSIGIITFIMSAHSRLSVTLKSWLHSG